MYLLIIQMNTIHIYSNTPLVDNCGIIKFDSIKNKYIFNNKNIIITDKSESVEHYVKNNFDILDIKSDIDTNTYILDKKIYVVNITNCSNTNYMTLNLTQDIFEKIGYLRCSNDNVRGNVHNVIIPNNLYISSVGKLINFIDETSYNYLSVDNEIIDKFYSYKNKCNFFDEITNYPINDLLNITDPQFVKYMLFYMIPHNEEITMDQSDSFESLTNIIEPNEEPSIFNFSFEYGNIEILFHNKNDFVSAKQIKLSDGNNIHIHHNISSLLFNHNYCSFYENEVEYIYKLQNMSNIVFEKNQRIYYFSIFDYLFIENKGLLYLWTDNNNLELINEFKSRVLTFSDSQIENYYKFASKIIKYKKCIDFDNIQFYSN